MRKRAVVYAIAGSILVGVSIVSAYLARSRSGVGTTAHLDFTLKDVSGADVRLGDLRGKPLIVNFWATWCGPCLLETPELVELQQQYRDRGLRIVGISYDDTPEQVKAFASEFKVDYPLLIGRDREDVFDAFRLGDALPTSVFIRPDGTIAARLEGINTKDWFQEQIERMLAE
jgi:thiol-disulfide isomerase/thioredoxin